MNDDRTNIEKKIFLKNENKEELVKHIFYIDKVINRGASCISYEAHSEGSGKGVLKEFFPKEFSSLKRNGSEQIDFEENADLMENFRKAEQKYLRPYEILLKIKQGENGKDISTFIPPFEIYENHNDNSMAGSSYIWSPEPKVETFDKICDEIHNNPEEKPQDKLFTVLSSIYTLTQCICLLHKEGLLHRDIKPSNFGFPIRNKKILTQAISLFDINSVCYIYEKNIERIGTECFAEPEVNCEEPTNQTDIYSIGATLFYAIAVTEETKENDYCYRDEFYGKIKRFVNESELLKSSEANSNPILRGYLSKILEKSLCRRAGRYSCCEELLEDLHDALFYLLPPEMANKYKEGGRWVLSDSDSDILDRNKGQALRYHLYEHPFYKCDEMNILIVGFGNYGQKFLDIALQEGQVLDKALDITVISQDKDFEKNYLSERPALSEFFGINKYCSDSYGRINFETQNCDDENIGNLVKNNKYNYIFIALGDDNLNYTVAKHLREITDECDINYVIEEKKSVKEETSKIYPIFVNSDIKESKYYSEIERMAFNAHLVWEKDLNIDYKTVKKAFNEKYNHDACVANVLSTKSKLYSVGIDLDTVSFEEAAKEFSNKISDEKISETKDKLIWIEHRRWVTEKICLGWQKMELDDCISRGETKNKRQKLHTCIVKSRPDRKLEKEYDILQWDNATDSELSQLDDLDRLSVLMHRKFKKNAKEVEKSSLSEILNLIKNEVENEKESFIAFQEWHTCIKDIVNKSERVYLYKGLKKSFEDAVKKSKMPEDKKKAINHDIQAFDSFFRPIYASKEYTDWKKYDVALVEKIPFILTYNENSTMVIPLECTTNDSIFRGVASATVVNPKKIIYLYLIGENRNEDNLIKSVPCIIGYMDKKLLRASIEFIIVCRDGVKLNEKTEEKLKENPRIQRVKIFVDNDSTADELAKNLKDRKTRIAMEQNDTGIYYYLNQSSSAKTIPSYSFNSSEMVFTNKNGCDMFTYIEKKPTMNVSDIFSFSRSFSLSSNQPEFFVDYKTLWNKFSENGRTIFNWKNMCTVLKDVAEKSDEVAAFCKNKPGESNKICYYIIPFICRKNAQKIIAFLMQKGIIGKDSQIEAITSDSCRVTLIDRYNNSRNFDFLFSNIHAMVSSDLLTIYENSQIHVCYNNLHIRNKTENQINNIDRKLLEYFRQLGYIYFEDDDININENILNLTFATHRIKDLMTNEGRILEIYVYHKLKESGYFDDIVSSYEVNWGNTDVKNEFDIIVTKGFQSAFIECKATNKLEQTYYEKLDSLTKHFGIKTKAVLIHYTQSDYNEEENQNQRDRGDELDITTVFKPEEIQNIDDTIFAILPGKKPEKTTNKTSLPLEASPKHDAAVQNDKIVCHTDIKNFNQIKEGMRIKGLIIEPSETDRISYPNSFKVQIGILSKYRIVYGIVYDNYEDYKDKTLIVVKVDKVIPNKNTTGNKYTLSIEKEVK